MENNATDNPPITLADYVSAREKVVLFYAGVGQPAGDYMFAGHPDYLDNEGRTDVEALGWSDLVGEIGEDGIWRWDGAGAPRDWNNNTVYQLQAYVDSQKWAALVAAVESEY